MLSDPVLLADVGGTHARFALLQNGDIRHIETCRAAEHASAADAVKNYLAKHQATAKHAVFAVAGPVIAGEDRITLTNHRAWDFSQKEFAAACGFEKLLPVNDFEALAHGIPHMQVQHLRRIGGSMDPVAGAPVAVIGPGTGLGVAAIAFDQGRATVIAGEGGNVTLPVATPREFALAQAIRAATGEAHVSVENVVSGIGLVNLYNAIRSVDGRDLPPLQAAAIASAALNDSCDACAEAVDLFCHFLGVAAGNLALTLGSFGGVYIAGGIIPQWVDHFARSRFRDSFEDKGRYRDYAARIPAFVVLHPYPAFEGLKRLAAQDSENAP